MVCIHNVTIRVEKGYLLLEAAVTLLLFIGGITTIVYYHGISMHMQRNARTRAMAIALTACCMERCRAQRCVPKESRIEESGVVLTWQVQPYVDELLSNRDGLIELTLKAHWQSDQGADTTYTLRSVIATTQPLMEAAYD